MLTRHQCLVKKSIKKNLEMLQTHKMCIQMCNFVLRDKLEILFPKVNNHIRVNTRRSCAPLLKCPKTKEVERNSEWRKEDTKPQRARVSGGMPGQNLWAILSHRKFSGYSWIPPHVSEIADHVSCTQYCSPPFFIGTTVCSYFKNRPHLIRSNGSF